MYSYTCTAPIVGPEEELSSSVQLHDVVQCVCTAPIVGPEEE